MALGSRFDGEIASCTQSGGVRSLSKMNKLTKLMIGCRNVEDKLVFLAVENDTRLGIKRESVLNIPEELFVSSWERANERDLETHVSCRLGVTIEIEG